MSDRRPNLFVVGAMRSGTTSVFNWLDQHPQVHTSDPKEPHWFAFPDVEPRYQGPGDDQLNDRIVWQRHRYLGLFDQGRDLRYRAEASAMYLHLPAALERLLDGPADVVAPDARYIVLLRDPAERSASAFEYNRMRGREPCRALADALDDEPRRREAGWSPMFWYEGASRVSAQVERLLETAPDRTLVLVRGDLADDAVATASRLFAWLELDAPVGLDTAPRNRSGEPRSALVARMLGRSPLKRRLKPLVPSGLVRALHRAREANLAGREARGGDDDSGAALEALRHRLADEAARLCELTGHPPEAFR